jgi:hypothetical protein
MPRFQGQISRDGRVILPSIAGNYFPYTGRRGRAAWSGGFDGTRENTIDAGGSYRLTLDDGRSGEIAVDLMTLSGHGVTNVHFRGLSAFEVATLADEVGE